MILSGVTKSELKKCFGVYVRKDNKGNVYLTQNGKKMVWAPKEIILSDDSLVAIDVDGYKWIIE